MQDHLAKDYNAFVHFCTNGVIRAQQDHSVSPPTSQWQAGQAVSDGPWNVTLSSSLPDGDYDWLIGLYDAAGDGSRVRLQGVDDGTSRIRLGVLHLANAGTVLTFTAETNAPALDPTVWYGQHLNNSNLVVDFGMRAPTAASGCVAKATSGVSRPGRATAISRLNSARNALTSRPRCSAWAAPRPR